MGHGSEPDEECQALWPVPLPSLPFGLMFRPFPFKQIWYSTRYQRHPNNPIPLMPESEELQITAVDGYPLAATLYHPPTWNKDVLIVSSATAVLRRFYRHTAEFFANQGYGVITYDYRGIGGSKPAHVRDSPARMRDWALLDMAGVLDWADGRLRPRHILHLGHSFGGQATGLLYNGRKISAMATVSSQSGYWRLQGGSQKLAVGFHMYTTFPLLSRLMGYMPWGKLSAAEDLPRGVALEWAKWCRNPHYLLGDPTLPLERYAQFQAPVLAYSFADDTWGTQRSVAALMQAYPHVTLQHITPAQVGLESIGHFGFFRPSARPLWEQTLAWFQHTLEAK